MSSPSLRGRVGLGGRGPADHGVRIVDTPAIRVHRPVDLVAAVAAALGIALVLVLAVYAQGTTTGLTEDVRGFASLLRRILFVPVTVLEGLITFIAPLAVLTELVLRRLVRQALEAIAAAVVATALALFATWLITEVGAQEMRDALSVWSRGLRVVTIPALLVGTAALLTAAGARNRRRTVMWSWNLLWIGLGIAVITGLVTLPGALITVLLGRVVGLGTRYLSGVQSERAYGASLVNGIRRAGFEPRRLIRVRGVSADHPGGDEELASDLAAVAITRYGDNRVYAMTTTDDERLDVVVLDGDRQVVGALARWWRSFRLRGIDGRAVVSLRQAAERAALLSYAAWSAGVCTPRLLGMAEADDSMILIQRHAHGAVPVRDLPVDELDDDVLDAVWEQLRVAHAAGLAHRALTADVVLVDRRDAPVAFLTGWESGDVASSELARRLDISQLLALLALRVGAERAVGAASRVLPDPDLTAVGPLLQTIALPRATREEARKSRGVLAEVREALLARLPEAEIEPERLVRFGARTVVTIALTVAAAVVVITTINFAEISAALATAQPLWAALAFGLGLLTFFGSALALVAFAPIRLPLWRATLVQTAAAFVALVAPAGVGPAALNLRMLTRRGVASPLAVASVGLVQVSQFITTVLLLVVLSLVSGTDTPLRIPSTTVIAALGVISLAIAAAMLVPPLRHWIAARVLPLWRQTWPRLVQMLGQPQRFALAAVGNMIMTMSYLGAFAAALAAFGREMSLIDLALIYLIGNAAGALVPSPGGLGTVEISLITGLTLTGGVPAAIATSVVFLFRALTFWARVPIGWLAMRTLQRTGEL
ncbi:lysylphosphatidylglycerol synthase transmembrane domain-containing protein [Actinotalea sp. C106]|uniref:lysylphosphatidylglycerol synthase transmembrane domain-containing protein n=1 Tax=Actinotalea sp. C106 TaxID=2908644 RepID=UPI002028419A|nr:lysylphosphatidylglycerol synthase transmembrane domain-containing protein [Actinotalea sp. C106]